jgi:hypothetical protein
VLSIHSRRPILVRQESFMDDVVLRSLDGATTLDEVKNENGTIASTSHAVAKITRGVPFSTNAARASVTMTKDCRLRLPAYSVTT